MPGCEMLNPAVRLCKASYNLVCILSGFRPPNYFFIKIIHVANLIIKVLSLSAGLVLFSKFGTPNSPMVDVVKSNTDHFVGAFLWFACVTALTMADLVRCVLLAACRWHSKVNRLDMTWHATNGLGIPFLVALVCAQLGVTDVFILMFVVVSGITCSLCELCAEELRTLKTKAPGENIFNRDVVSRVIWTLCILQNVIVFAIIAVSVFPVVLNLNWFPIYSTRFFLLHSVVALLFCLMGVQTTNQVMYSKLENTRKDMRSLLPASATVASNQYEIPISPVIFPVSDLSSKYQQEIDIDADPFDAEVSERVFDHVYEDNPKTDVKSTELVTIRFNETFEIYRRSSCLRGSLYDDGVYVKSLGESGFETDSDGDGTGTRIVTGLSVEWKRYYVTSMFVNILLIASLVDMTGCMQDW